MERLHYWLGLTALPYPMAASIVVSDFLAWLKRWWLGGILACPRAVTVTVSAAGAS